MSERTAYNWLRRYREEGPDGLQDRSSKPLHSPSRTADDTQAQVFALGRERCIYDRIAEQLHISRATVGRILTRHGLNHWRDLEPAEPVIQYERAAPGEMVHIDIKKLGKFERVGHRITGSRQEGASRGAGWEFVHVCVDDHSRIAFPKAAVTWYQGLGIKVDRVMTDNGSCYRSKAFNKVCAAMGLRHIYTKPDRPKTNGKAERFIQSSLREWAYARAYDSSRQRKLELPYWLHHYNWHRHHAGTKGKTPISRSGLDLNNLMRLHN